MDRDVADRESEFRQFTAFQRVSFLLFFKMMANFVVSRFFRNVHSGAKLLVGGLVGVICVR